MGMVMEMLCMGMVMEMEMLCMGMGMSEAVPLQISIGRVDGGHATITSQLLHHR